MRSGFILSVFACASFVSTAFGVVVADNGAGTAYMPIHAPYKQESPMQIIDGLPAGTTIQLPGQMIAPLATAEQAGGSLGGTQSAAETGFSWNLQGTGGLTGFSRPVFIPLSSGGTVASFPAAPPNSGIEVHAAPRTAFAPVQSFDTTMFRLFGQITGDPDFDLLRIVGGTDFGLPSPGHTTLTQSGPNWAVDSFFDLTYRIDFIGKPGGPLSGMSGSTTGTVRISIPEPMTAGALIPAALFLRRRRSM